MFVVCVVFFFKQKTAYEMRISDWSSDVCSSDLRSVPLHSVEHPLVAKSIKDISETVLRGVPFEVPFLRTKISLRHHATANHTIVTLIFAEEIGRASCRERVCKYV